MDTGLSGPKLGLFRGDITMSRVGPLPIVVAFDAGEQVPFGGLTCWVLLVVPRGVV